jgi:hypothetical protein
LDRLDLVQTGLWGRPKGPQLLEQAHLEPDFIAIYYQNCHKTSLLLEIGVVGLVYDNS